MFFFVFVFYATFSEIRKDAEVRTALESKSVYDLQFHQTCLNDYTHIKGLRKIIREREKAEEEVSRKKSRQDSSPSLPRRSIRQKDVSGSYVTLFKNLKQQIPLLRIT